MMGINHICYGILVAVGIQLPAMQSGPQNQGQAWEEDMHSEKFGWVPKSEKEVGKGLPGVRPGKGQGLSGSPQ